MAAPMGRRHELSVSRCIEAVEELLMRHAAPRPKPLPEQLAEHVEPPGKARCSRETRPARVFKECSARNLGQRDLVVPHGVLVMLFEGGQVPSALIADLMSSHDLRLPTVTDCVQTESGLAVRFDRREMYSRVLGRHPASDLMSDAGTPEGHRASLEGTADQPSVKTLSLNCCLPNERSSSEDGYCCECQEHGNLPEVAKRELRSSVVVNCPCLQRCEPLTPGHLRSVLLAHQLSRLLSLDGYHVYKCPAIKEGAHVEVLKPLRVEWPTLPAEKTAAHGDSDPLTDPVAECRSRLLQSGFAEPVERQSATETKLSRRSEPELETNRKKEKAERETRVANEAKSARSSPDQMYRVNLQQFVSTHCLEGMDPNLNTVLVDDEYLAQVVELEAALNGCQGGETRLLHIVCCEEEFNQQKVHLLLQLVGQSDAVKMQRHVVVGSVKTGEGTSQVDALDYLRLRRAQMKEASVMKYGNSVQGPEWEEIIDVMTAATVKFELLSSAHRSTLPLELGEGAERASAARGRRSGTFVMYNSARLSTLFQNYRTAVKRGMYPKFPEVSSLDFSLLNEEEEWRLLYNYIVPFGELLSRSSHLEPARGIHATAHTDVLYKFLVELSMDFSSYYNRVRVLSEPVPHLSGIMFARLRLLERLQEVMHAAMSALGLPPLKQI
ncbi:DALR anticodon-binding domain-containing protein 3 isoform X1 [Petromyzon marinus]|uniref:DALR anticodon-binding domain-containing protein 3 isoform X1 n=1 Tax=Petromyzon marinus TaxID=7757 RepID=UPI003F715737